MDAKNINIVINSVLTTFKSALDITPAKKEVYLKNVDESTEYLTAAIEATGKHSGVFAISVSKPVAIRLAASMSKKPMTAFDNNVIDAVGELINIITGRVKAAIAEDSETFNLTPPIFVLGEGRSLTTKKPYAPFICVSFLSNLGEFTIEVALR